MAAILLFPFVWTRREEFQKISQKEWLLLFFSGLFLALHFALWFGLLNFCRKFNNHSCFAAYRLIDGGFILYTHDEVCIIGDGNRCKRRCYPREHVLLRK
nr:hypothetical protein [Oceanobacillus polygoni]